MTFLRVRGNDSLGGEGSTRESRENQGAITHMSRCKAKTDIRPASSDPARTQVPYEATSRSAPIRILRLAQVIDMTARQDKNLRVTGAGPLPYECSNHHPLGGMG